MTTCPTDLVVGAQISTVLLAPAGRGASGPGPGAHVNDALCACPLVSRYVAAARDFIDVSKERLLRVIHQDMPTLLVLLAS